MKRVRGPVIDALIGRKIVKAECERWNGAQDGSAPVWVHTWALTLDSGAKVSFLAEETEVGEYGVDMRSLRDQRALDRVERGRQRAWWNQSEDEKASLRVALRREQP